MCGIAGYAGSAPSDVNESSVAALRHRGPDGAGGWCNRPVGREQRVRLAHTRLAILDLTNAGAQPMRLRCSACGIDKSHVVIVFNGEIYNFQELRRLLAQAGHELSSHTDTEILLHLYCLMGLRMFEALNGMYALAIYDGRDRPQNGLASGDVLIARDPVGIKPLYYDELPHGIAFASELKALLQLRHTPAEIDHQAFAYTLAYLWTPSPITPFKQIRKLEPGTILRISEGRIVDRRIIKPPWSDAVVQSGSVDARADQLQSVLRDAVARQNIADVEVGAFLSGGVDSSLLVALTKQVTGQAPRSYTIGFARDRMEGFPEDLPYAQRVARHLQVPLREVVVEDDLFMSLPEMIWHMDEPNADPAAINVWQICRAARQDGLKVLLSGTGGDDLFTGYRRHRFASWDAWLGRIPGHLRAGLSRWSGQAQITSARWRASTVGRRITRSLLSLKGSPDERLARTFLWSSEQFRTTVLNPQFANAGYDNAVLQPLIETLQLHADEHPVKRILHAEQRFFLADHNLHYVDRMSMAVGVEVRVPYLDNEVMAFSRTLPVSMLQRARQDKYILRKAAESVLPATVAWRRKTGFGVPLRKWLQSDRYGFARDMLSADVIRRRGIFNPEAVGRMLALNSAGKVDLSYPLFAVLCIELWLQAFVDKSIKSGSAPIARYGNTAT